MQPPLLPEAKAKGNEKTNEEEEKVAKNHAVNPIKKGPPRVKVEANAADDFNYKGESVVG